MADALQYVANGVVQFIDANRGLVAGVAIGLGVIGGLGITLMGVSGAVTLVATAIGGAKLVVGGLAIAFGALTSPIGLVVFALAAVAAALIEATIGWDKFLAAAMKGDWSLIGDAIGDGMLLGFVQGLAEMRDLWVHFVGMLQDSIDDLDWNKPSNERGLSKSQEAIADGILRLKSGIRDAWMSAIGDKKGAAKAREEGEIERANLRQDADARNAQAKKERLANGGWLDDALDELRQRYERTMAKLNANTVPIDAHEGFHAGGMKGMVTGDKLNEALDNLIVAATGASSSAQSRALGMATPGNTFEDQLLNEEKSQGKTLDEILKHIRGLNNLTVE